MSTPIKTCPGCGEIKPIEAFHRHKRDGRASRCKSCAAKYGAAYHSENRERLAQLKAAYRNTSAGRCSDWASGYRERAHMYGLEPVVEPFTVDDVVSLYGDACAHCGGPFEHLDHFPVPVALGGHHTLANVRPSCAPCNLAQGKAVHLAASSQ